MSADLLPTNAVRIHAVQFVGTNVEMTVTVDPAAATDTHAALDGLLQAKLGLYAITPTGELEGRPRFSVIASPLDRLFHKIGPIEPLTLIKHTSTTLDLSDAQLARLAEGLADRLEPDGVAPFWDCGKLIAVLMRRPEVLEAGPASVADVPLEPEAFPQEILPTLPAHVAEAGGVRLRLPASALTAAATASP